MPANQAIWTKTDTPAPDRWPTRSGGPFRRKTNNQITYRTPFLKRYSANYSYGRYQDGKPAGGRIEYVRLFSIIAVFILVMACINFMNLSTAKAAKRAREKQRDAQDR